MRVLMIGLALAAFAATAAQADKPPVCKLLPGFCAPYGAVFTGSTGSGAPAEPPTGADGNPA